MSFSSFVVSPCACFDPITGLALDQPFVFPSLRIEFDHPPKGTEIGLIVLNVFTRESMRRGMKSAGLSCDGYISSARKAPRRIAVSLGAGKRGSNMLRTERRPVGLYLQRQSKGPRGASERKVNAWYVCRRNVSG